MKIQKKKVMQYREKENIITVTILTILTILSCYYLFESIAAHKELLREIKVNRETLEVSQKALQQKLLLLEEHKPVPVIDTSSSFYGISWKSIAIGVGVGVVVVGLVVLGSHMFSPPTDPGAGAATVDRINDASKALSLVHDQIADLGNKGEAIAVDRAQSVSLIENRHISLLNGSKGKVPLVNSITNNMMALGQQNEDQLNLLDEVLSSLKKIYSLLRKK